MKPDNSYNDTLDRVGLDRLILQNNITQIDPGIWDDPQLWNTDDDENSEPVEVYQWYATNISTQHQADICKLHGLMIVYSDIMDTYYLAVDHYGTSWDYVPHHDPMNE